MVRALKSHGMLAHAKEFDQAIRALRVINSWARFRSGFLLDPEHVAKLTEKALKPYREKHDNA